MWPVEQVIFEEESPNCLQSRMVSCHQTFVESIREKGKRPCHSFFIPLDAIIIQSLGEVCQMLYSLLCNVPNVKVYERVIVLKASFCITKRMAKQW